jgi:uncharacterized membrane protein
MNILIRKSAMESFIEEGVNILKLIIEVIGAIFVGIGCLLALIQYIKGQVNPKEKNFTRTRLILARYLALALEFQLGADILATAIAPSWDTIGKLAAIAVIRTVLNYFLSKEMEKEEEAISSVS